VYRECFRQTIELYLEGYLGPEPRWPSTWKRDRAICPYYNLSNARGISGAQALLHCELCYMLNAFLEHPDYSSFTWLLKRPHTQLARGLTEEKHLQKAIDNGRTACSVQRSGSVTDGPLYSDKTWAFEGQIKKWHHTCPRVLEQIRSLGEATLKDVFEEDFDDIWNARKQRLPETSAMQKPAMPPRKAFADSRPMKVALHTMVRKMMREQSTEMTANEERSVGAGSRDAKRKAAELEDEELIDEVLHGKRSRR
jgi:hypothetical protein